MTLISLLAAANPVDHVNDKPLLKVKVLDEPIDLSPIPIYIHDEWWLLSNATVMLVVGAIVTSLLVLPAAKRIVTGDRGDIEDFRAKGILANLIESVCVYLRDEVFRPVLGHDTDRYTPMLWTFFFFILICNLLGLVPLVDITGGLMGLNHGFGIGGTATQSIWVTFGLSVTAFVFYNTVAIVKDPLGYLKHLTGGAPWFMWPIMIPVEIIGTLVKPVALMLRLFANMTGGHIVLAVFLGLVGQLVSSQGLLLGSGIGIIPLIGAFAILMLEVLVSFIQAFIFTFLTCLFLGQLVVHEHDEEHADEAVHDAMDAQGVAFQEPEDDKPGVRPAH